MLFEVFLSTPAMEAVFSPAAVVQSMMDVEAALVRAQSKAGLMPPAAAQAISSLCRAELYDVPSLLAAAPAAGSLAMPTVQRLRETVALFDPSAAVYVHRNACAQDIVDTAMVLCTREALRIMDDDLQALCAQLLDLARRHEAVPMLGRTLMQPAQVISLRYKFMNWLMPLVRSAEMLRTHAREALRLQLGGPVGTLESLGVDADKVSRLLSEDLGLPVSDMCWHTQRDRWIRLATELGVLCGSMGKLAQDLALLAQPEVDEIVEAPTDGRGSCIALPHKHNPIAAQQALAATQRAPHRVAALLGCMSQAHERGLGQWPAELAEWSSLMGGTHGALIALRRALSAPDVRTANMRANVDAQLGLVASERLELLLTPRLGRQRTDAIVQDLIRRVRQGQGSLMQMVRESLERGELPEHAISTTELSGLFDVQTIAAWADSRVEAPLTQAGVRLEELAAHPFT
ncbi:lyase family protein [Roseateles sp. SL47]|uniref:lyase family protein n=1 Tax=Roseateles sp. SL47 TaxID=2995138 RepID=UPI0022706048|nr:lyase family protein [Roseateles sp. SL47]WAC72670.1 lyase family protein [Roseateles sp. SL47]